MDEYIRHSDDACADSGEDTQVRYVRSSSLIDVDFLRAQLSSLGGGASQEFIDAICTTFQESVSSSTDRLSRAIEEQDYESLKVLCMGLAGGSRQVGIQEIAEVCDAVIAAAKEAQWDRAKSTTARLQKLAADAQAELPQAVQEIGAEQ